MTKPSTVKNLFQLFRRIPFTKKNQNNNVIMGRWNLDYDNTIQNRKIYWANMDNCGCCDQKNVTVKVTHDDSEDYILPYVM
jgi:type IV pilus biogenesis protein CpaD/CtpE